MQLNMGERDVLFAHALDMGHSLLKKLDVSTGSIGRVGAHSLTKVVIQKLVFNLNSVQPGRAFYNNGSSMQGLHPMLFVRSGSNEALISSTGNNNKNIQVYALTVQPADQPLPVYRNQGSIMKNEAQARVISLGVLNPYQERWAIKARVKFRRREVCSNFKEPYKDFSVSSVGCVW
ncbi:unnamed protein product [Linum trigynum]|uniref:Uncharacterized protein n=1 Tax=Linum trigynum TaxID=586398 RepID=A0AAV2E7R5_9ROSI